MMEKFDHKIGVLIFMATNLSIALSYKPDSHVQSCSNFSTIMGEIKRSVETKQEYDWALEDEGYVTPHSIFGVRSNDEYITSRVEHAKIDTVAAQIFKAEYNVPPDEFQSITAECSKSDYVEDHITPLEIHQKYRAVDGRGNNAKNPYWGASLTPFSRFVSKNYEDGIYAIKKSVTDGSDLPNARSLVRDVLSKAVRSAPPAQTLNVMGLLLVLFATHDLHYQVPVQPRDGDKEILCCSKNKHHVADKTLSNSACLPIEVSKKDELYEDGKIGCLNMIRSQINEFPGQIQPGEIMNQATSYIDLSLIYGNRESEMEEVRLYEGGKLRMGKNNVLPVDANGEYIKPMDRFIAVPIASIWPSLFARNHNHLAERLSLLNPHWDDEILFQEARRINIANLQFIMIGTKAIESVFGRPVNEKYSESTNAGTFVEFALTYRAAHYYMPSDMLFHSENHTELKRLHHSDTIGKISLLVDNFDEALRAATNQPVNVGQFSDEIINRIGKDSTDGYGVDLIAIDIQRGRDHGVPSFAEIRRKCKLSPEITSFDNLHLIFNQTNVNLLKKVYKSYEDVDLYVGGMLEFFEHVVDPLAGPTFGCIIGENYSNAMGGDIYWFTHPENPYPMTKEQIDAISNYAVSNLFCTNSGLKETNEKWPFSPSVPMNPKIDCRNFPPMDLSAWKEITKKKRANLIKTYALCHPGHPLLTTIAKTSGDLWSTPVFYNNKHLKKS